MSELHVFFACEACRAAPSEREPEPAPRRLAPPRNAREAARRRAAGHKKALAILAGGCATYATLMGSILALTAACAFVMKRGGTPLVAGIVALGCGWLLVTVMTRVVCLVTMAERRINADVEFRDHLERGEAVLRGGGPAGQLAIVAPEGRSGALSDARPRGAVAIARVTRPARAR